MLYSYVVTRDFGFAPNPFGKYCTLATCKPGIRKSASIGDWVIGTGSTKHHICMGNRLIYAMQVSEKMSFSEYWVDPRFTDKKPVMNGSLKQKYGDNIYYYDETLNRLVQVNSHHSQDDGSTNVKNYDLDTKGHFVLISKDFWYFGENAPEIPIEIRDRITKKGMGYKKISDEKIVNEFVVWLSKNFEKGYNGRPINFNGKFVRYKG